jgi:hypothetical protein
MTPETLCETNEMQEIIELAEELIKAGANLEQIQQALDIALG